MRGVRVGLAFAVLALAGSCAPRPRPAPPAPPPQLPVPRPAPPAPPAADWRDAPLSPGDWTYRSEGAATIASFGLAGRPSFVVRCEPGRQITLARAGAATAMIIRTSSGPRSFAARNAGGSLAASLSASDPFLDAIAFSRGRFAVEAAGLPTLIVPPWPELARVIEDCRN